MVHDATARLYGVDHDSIEYTRIGDNLGTIEFRARTGMLVDLEKLRDSIRLIRSNGFVISFEVTALGAVEQTESEIILNINGTNRQFVLVNDVEAKPPNDPKESALAALREALARGGSSLSVTGYMDEGFGMQPVEGIDRRPVFLEQPPEERPQLMVIGFESVEDEAAFAVSNPSGAQDEIELIENSLGMKLVRIPAGTFMMGSPRSEPDRIPNEELHEVSITRPFYMSIHEVTQAQYGASDDDMPHFGSYLGGGDGHPMEYVGWWHAVRFCRDLSNRPEESRAGRRYRLPTEAEWEYACRAGTTTPFHTGESLSSREANFNGNTPYGGAEEGPFLEMTAPVGSYEPNAFGLYDMHGNVSEWCADFYDPDYYENSPQEDPPGPDRGVAPRNYWGIPFVVRGGSWLDDARGCRSAYRFRGMRVTRYETIGFRVVCEVTRDPE